MPILIAVCPHALFYIHNRLDPDLCRPLRVGIGVVAGVLCVLWVYLVGAVARVCGLLGRLCLQRYFIDGLLRVGSRLAVE